MAGGMLLDGFDTQDVGFTVISDLSGWRDSVARQIPTAGRPGRLGSLRLTSRIRAPARSTVIRGFQKGDSVAQLLTRLDELKWRAWNADEIQLVFDDKTDRFFRARLDGKLTVSGIQPALSQLVHRIELPMVCDDPRAYSDTQESLSIASTDGDVALPLGTAPTEATIEVDQTSFTLTYKDSSGATVATLEVSGASTQPVTVDMADQTITTANGGEIDVLASGDFFAFDPHDGDFPASSWPTLAVSAGTASVSYRRAWL